MKYDNVLRVGRQHEIKKKTFMLICSDSFLNPDLEKKTCKGINYNNTWGIKLNFNTIFMF